MSKLRVCCFGISLDGYGAGPGQDLNNPLGIGGFSVHKWHISTRTFQRLHGDGTVEGTEGVDDEFEAQGLENIGAWIMGRNMFGPIRGSWPNADWKGWWGANPPYHVPVFVLTHYPRPDTIMEGGTTFHFVVDGIESALQQARRVAKGKDIRLGGGVATIREYLKAALIDELHLAISPTFLGSGEHLLKDIDVNSLGYLCDEKVTSGQAAHMLIRKRAG
jgi:dihydrofolate reductase